MKLLKKIERTGDGFNSYIELEMSFEQKKLAYKNGMPLLLSDVLENYNTYRTASRGGPSNFPTGINQFASRGGVTVAFPTEAIALSFEQDVTDILKKYVGTLRGLEQAEANAREMNGKLREEEI